MSSRVRELDPVCGVAGSAANPALPTTAANRYFMHVRLAGKGNGKIENWPMTMGLGHGGVSGFEPSGANRLYKGGMIALGLIGVGGREIRKG